MSYTTYLRTLVLVLSVIAMSCHSDHGSLITCNSIEAIKKQMIYQVGEVTANWDIPKEHDFGTVEATSTWYWVTDKIKLTNFTIKHIELNLNNTNASAWQTEQVFFSTALIGSNIFKIIFQFEYEYSALSSGKGQGEVEVSSASSSLEKRYIFEKNNGTANDSQHITGETGNILSDFSIIKKFDLVIGDYSTDPHVLELGKTAFVSIMDEQQYKDLHIKFDTAFDQYYESQETKRILLQTTLPPINTFFYFSTRHVPVTKVINGTKEYLFGYDGDFRDINKTSVERVLTEKNQSFGTFAAPIGDYRILLKPELFQSLFNHLSMKNRTMFSINSTNIPSSIGFTINVEAISKFYNSK